MIKIYKRQLGEYHDRESGSNALEKIIEKKNRGLLNGMKISKQQIRIEVKNQFMIKKQMKIIIRW